MNAKQLIIEMGRGVMRSAGEERREVQLGQQIKFHVQRVRSGEQAQKHLRQIEVLADELIEMHT